MLNLHRLDFTLVKSPTNIPDLAIIVYSCICISAACNLCELNVLVVIVEQMELGNWSLFWICYSTD